MISKHLHHSLLSIGVLLIFGNASYGQAKIETSDTTEEVSIQSHRAFVTYHFDSLKNTNSSFNAINSLVGKIGITTDNFYAANFEGGKIQNRMQGESLVLLHGVPMNAFRLNESNETWEPYQYYSSLGINDYQVVRGSGRSSDLGSMAQNGVISFSQSKSNILGFSGGLVTQFNHARSKDLPQENFQSYGAYVNYNTQRASVRLDAEINKGNNDVELASHNISLVSTYDILKNLEVSVFLNVFKSAKREKVREEPSFHHEGTREIAAINLNYNPIKGLKFLGGMSILNMSRSNNKPLFRISVQKEGSSVIETEYGDSGERGQKHAYLTGQYTREIVSNWNIKAQTGFKVNNWSENTLETLNVDGDNYFYESSNVSLNQRNGFMDVSVNYDNIIHVGYAINRERELDSSRGKQKISTIYSSIVLSEWFVNHELISDAVLRFNKTSGYLEDDFMEFGADLGFWKNRLVLSGTYYFSDIDDNILGVSSGVSDIDYRTYESQVNYKGFEFDISLKPRPFWTSSMNWSNAKFELNSGNLDYLSIFMDEAINGLIYSEFSDSRLNLYPISFDYAPENPDWLLYFNNDFIIGNYSFGCFISYKHGGVIGIPSRYDDENSQTLASQALDASALVLRNLYLEYRFEQVLFTRSISLGVSGQNLLAKTNLPGNTIIRDYPVQLYNHSSSRQNERTINLNVRIDF